MDQQLWITLVALMLVSMDNLEIHPHLEEIKPQPYFWLFLLYTACPTYFKAVFTEPYSANKLPSSLN